MQILKFKHIHKPKQFPLMSINNYGYSDKTCLLVYTIQFNLAIIMLLPWQKKVNIFFYLSRLSVIKLNKGI